MPCRPVRSCVAALALGVVLAGAPAMRGQTASPPQDPPQSQQPTFRARVDSVSVDVIVTDRQGKPITDLKVEDFEVKEANKVQKIDAFKYISIDETQEADPLYTRQILSMAEQQRETANEQNRIFVIMLDDYHVRRGNGMRIREQLASWVSSLSSRDLVAILYPLTPLNATTFSRNHDGTAGAIRNFDGRKYDYTPRNAYEERYQMQPPQTQEQMRNDLVIAALQGACTYLGTLREGRKTLLYVSEGMSGTLPAGVNTTGSLFPRTATTATSQTQQFFNSTDLLSRLRDVFNAAARANAAIYTLDPRGLTTEEFDIADKVDSATNRQILNESSDLLRVLADQTDGRAIVGRNDPLPELRKMVRDVSSYYLLGYTSSVAARDGKFHEIKVARQAAGRRSAGSQGLLGVHARGSRTRQRGAQGGAAARDRPGARCARHRRRAGGPEAGDRLDGRGARTGRKGSSDPRLGSAARSADDADRRRRPHHDQRDVDLRRQVVQRSGGARSPGRHHERASDVRRPGGRGACSRRVREREREPAGQRRRQL